MTATPKILLAPSSFAASDPAPLERLRLAGAEVLRNPYGRVLGKPELVELLPGVTGIIAGLEPLTRDVLERSDLRVVSRCGAGLENVDLAAARELGIEVRSTPDAPTTAVAELTLGALIALLRQISQANTDVKEGRWVKRAGVQLEGKTVLVVGFGRIGRKVAVLMKAFGANVVASDPRFSGFVEGVPVLPLDETLPKADIVTLHASGQDILLGGAEFGRLKPGAFLLNAARGALVDEAALVDALEDGRVAGAWIDTFSREPYSGPLQRHPQVILTPHIGSYTTDCRRQMEMEAVENLLVALAQVIGVHEA